MPAEEKLTELVGTVEEIVFRNEETGFTVLELSDGVQLHTVVGEIPGIDLGEEVRVTGSFVMHPSYGAQFKGVMFQRQLPSSSAAIYKYLSSGAIKGVGKAIARRLVDAFGEKTLQIMEESPWLLSEVKGISPKKAEQIAKEFQRMFGIRTVMAFLSSYGIDTPYAIRVWRLWENTAADVIRENPYALCCEEVGLPFEEADRVAEQLGFEADSPCRRRGVLLHVLRHNLENGHCCLPWEKLILAAAQMVGLTSEEMEETAEELAAEESVISDTADGVRYAYLPELYEAETYVAGRIRMMTMLQSPKEEGCEAEIARMERQEGITYAALQRQAIRQAAGCNVLVLTGGPGTGKTTTLKAILQVLEDRGLSVALAAPTGRAAKRMSQLTGREAKTIHRLLEVDYRDQAGHSSFKRNEKNPLPQDAVIVDEMSMVDILLMHSLMKALRMSCKLILVGDPDQLPSVGPGNVLKDLIDSERVPAVHLSEVFRQAAQSLIVTNAHAIVSGEVPELGKRDNDFFLLARSSLEAVAATAADLCQIRLPRSYGYSPMEDIQVICPTRQGLIGTVHMNAVLQQRLNPPSPEKDEFKNGAYLFRTGDKVMQIKNNYDILYQRDDGEEGMGIFNGDIGTIELIDLPSQSVLVRFDDRVAEYSFEMAGELELAYAITVHKSQGNEFEAVILPLYGSHGKLYYRNLLYTAVTRAKKLLVIVGSAASVQRMVQNNRKTLRYTNLKAFLQE